jgi:uncharacterized protein YcbX
MTISVIGLYIYPIKSCSGSFIERAVIGSRGFVHDREFMIVDREGLFLTQREIPKLSLVKPEIKDGQVHLSAPGMPALEMEINTSGKADLEVTVWHDSCRAIDQGDKVANWLSDFISRTCRLVRLKDDFVRPVEKNYAKRVSDQVGFADGFPFLLIGQSSLDDLNRRLPTPLPMNRFRPNIVISGSSAFAEDEWKKIKIADVEFDLVKPCTRCVITCVNQSTSEVSKEPLKTLATFRQFGGKIHFGQNLVHANCGNLSVGDLVQIT